MLAVPPPLIVATTVAVLKAAEDDATIVADGEPADTRLFGADVSEQAVIATEAMIEVAM
jgi:hypothetical protein